MAHHHRPHYRRRPRCGIAGRWRVGSNVVGNALSAGCGCFDGALATVRVNPMRQLDWKPSLRITALICRNQPGASSQTSGHRDRRRREDKDHPRKTSSTKRATRQRKASRAHQLKLELSCGALDRPVITIESSRHRQSTLRLTFYCFHRASMGKISVKLQQQKATETKRSQGLVDWLRG